MPHIVYRMGWDQLYPEISSEKSSECECEGCFVFVVIQEILRLIRHEITTTLTTTAGKCS